MDVDNLTQITEPNAWTAAELPGREAWALELTREMIDEVIDAARKAIDAGRGYREIDQKNF